MIFRVLISFFIFFNCNLATAQGLFNTNKEDSLKSTFDSSDVTFSNSAFKVVSYYLDSKLVKRKKIDSTGLVVDLFNYDSNELFDGVIYVGRSDSNFKSLGFYNHQDGISIDFYPSSRIKEIWKINKNGMYDFHFVYCSDGQLYTKKTRMTLDLVQVEGYHCNGNKRLVGQLKGQSKVGLWIYYDAEGLMINKQNFD